LRASNTTIKTLTFYTDPVRHNAQGYRETDGRTSSRYTGNRIDLKN